MTSSEATLNNAMQKVSAKTGKVKSIGDKLECGMISIKMFQIPHSKALIIAYLDMRSGLKDFNFNVKDISKKTNISKTVVRPFVAELVEEGVLDRRGKSFYKLNRQRMKSLYYEVSESDIFVSETDTHVSETDTKGADFVSETDTIHSTSSIPLGIDSRKHSDSLSAPEDKVPVMENQPDTQTILRGQSIHGAFSSTGEFNPEVAVECHELAGVQQQSMTQADWDAIAAESKAKWDAAMDAPEEHRARRHLMD